MKVQLLKEPPKEGKVLTIDRSLLETGTCIVVDDVALVLADMSTHSTIEQPEEVNCTITRPKTKIKRRQPATVKDLIQHREGAGLTKDAVAKSIGVSPFTLTKVERGNPITERTRKKIEKFLRRPFEAQIRSYDR